MPLPAISLKEAKRRIGAIETALKAGHRPSTQPGRGPTAMGVAADALSMPRSTLQASLSRIERLHGLRPDRRPRGGPHEQAWAQAPFPQGQGRQPRPQAQRLTTAPATGDDEGVPASGYPFVMSYPG